MRRHSGHGIPGKPHHDPDAAGGGNVRHRLAVSIAAAGESRHAAAAQGAETRTGHPRIHPPLPPGLNIPAPWGGLSSLKILLSRDKFGLILDSYLLLWVQTRDRRMIFLPLKNL